MKKVIVLAPHDLRLDPRIKWMAESLLKYFEVSAIGIKQHAQDPIFDSRIKITQLNSRPKYLSGLKALVEVIPFGYVMLLSFIAFLLLPVFIALILIKLAKLNKAKFFQSIRWTSDAYFLAYTLKQFFSIFSQFADYFEKHQPTSVNFVVANDLDSLLPALLLKKKIGCEIIYDAHEFYPFQFANATAVLSFPLSLIEKAILPHVRSMITVTPQLALAIQDYYKLNKVIYSIPNCAPIQPWVPVQKDYSDKLVFLFQGVFAPGRGIETLINFWMKINPKNAVLVLRGPKNEFRYQCEKLAHANKAFPSIIFDGPVSEEELILAAAKADVGLIPYEPTSINNLNCCPNKLSQYMQSGIAILANDLPFVTEMLKRSQAGLVYSSNDFHAFEEKLNLLLNNQSLLSELKRNSRSFAEEFYNWDQASSVVFKEVFGLE